MLTSRSIVSQMHVVQTYQSLYALKLLGWDNLNNNTCNNQCAAFTYHSVLILFYYVDATPVIFWINANTLISISSCVFNTTAYSYVCYAVKQHISPSTPCWLFCSLRLYHLRSQIVTDIVRKKMFRQSICTFVRTRAHFQTYVSIMKCAPCSESLHNSLFGFNSSRKW